MVELTEEDYARLESAGVLEKIENGSKYHIELVEDSPHYAKVWVYIEDKMTWHGWLRAPQNLKERRDIDVEQVCKFHGITPPFCFFCGRIKEELGVNETLTGDHIQKLVCGGKDEVKNKQVLCSACHKLKHWSDTYITAHLVRGKRKKEGL
jgi:5-methylcytosine-specific restriction endonuclease McrA